MQEVSQDSYIDIPDEILNIYRLWRPSPLVRARRLERPSAHRLKYILKTRVYRRRKPQRIPRSRRPITQERGINSLSTETDPASGKRSVAGVQLFRQKVHVYMVRVSHDQKTYRKFMMETWGGTVTPTQPANERGTRDTGARSAEPRKPRHRHHEAVEEAATNKDTNYSLEACSTRLHAPDDHWAGDAQAARAGRRLSRRGHRLRGRRLEFLGIAFPSCATRSTART